MGHFIAAILGIAITFYMAMIYGSTSIALLGFGEAVFVVGSFGYLLYLRKHLQFRIEVPITLAERGQSVNVRIAKSGHALFASSKVKYLVTIRSSFQKKMQKKWLSGEYDSKEESRNQYELSFQASGNYEIGLKQVRIYDLTGLFYFTQRDKGFGNVEIMPDIHEVQVRLTERARNFFGDADVYDEKRPGQDMNEVFQIRPFQNGDKIQSVHWKLSARTDELMVKESSMPKACSVVLILDAAETGTKVKGKHSDRIQLDAFFSAAASISFSMMDAGCPHYVAWYSGEEKDVVRMRVDDEESFYQFLSYFLSEGGSKDTVDVYQLYKQKYHSEFLLHRYVLNKELVLAEGDKAITTLHSDNLEKELSDTEFIL